MTRNEKFFTIRTVYAAFLDGFGGAVGLESVFGGWVGDAVWVFG